MTAHTLSDAKAIPAPESVMMTPPPADPDATAELGVNEIVAVVWVAFMEDERAIRNLFNHDIEGKKPFDVASSAGNDAFATAWEVAAEIVFTAA